MTDTAHGSSHWFQYFPRSYMWSQGVMSAIEMAPFGAAAMGEIDQVGRRLRGREGDNDAWCEEWSRMGERLEARARAEDVLGHRLTAGRWFLHAATYFGYGERYLHMGERKLSVYRRGLDCFAHGMARCHPRAQRVLVPYEGTTLPAWYLPAAREAGAGPSPAVVFFNGLDGTKEVGILYRGLELAARGISTLAIDGPGQGETLRLQGLPSRHDWEVPARAALDYLCSRDDVDPDRIAIMGISMGGYFAPRAAAFEPRFAACVCWGGHYDYHAVWEQRRREFERGGSRVSAPFFHLLWVLGVEDMDAAMRRLEPYTLEGVASRLRCPLLVVHGANDSIVPVARARELHAAAGSADRTLRIFDTEEGGSEHCQGDNRMIGATFVADWLADRLLRSTPSRATREAG